MGIACAFKAATARCLNDAAAGMAATRHFNLHDGPNGRTTSIPASRRQ